MTITRKNVALAATAGLLAGLTTAAVAAPAGAAGEVQAAAPTTGAATIGVSRIENGARVFYVASSFEDGGGTVTRVVFGNADDAPILAQNDVGQCEPAVYRSGNATFYQASASIDGGGTVVATKFGNAGDRPVQNSLGANGFQYTVQLRRPSTATTYTLIENLDHSPKRVVHDVFGNTSDVAFGGGVYRPSNSTFYFEEQPNSPKPPTVQQFGSTGDQGFTGAFATGDTSPQDYVGVFRPSAGRWFLSQQATTMNGAQQPPITNVKTFTFGSPGDTALSCTNNPLG